MDNVAKSLRNLKALLGDAMTDPVPALDGVLTAEIADNSIVKALEYLRNDRTGGFDMLTDLTAVDWMNYPESGDRFEIVYHLTSSQHNHRVRLKTRVPELAARLDSATKVFRCANWLEREVYDMFGIVFDGHPDLRRILLWEDFEGYPLRKDFPTRGHHPVERTPES